ncbi:MAG: endonuclease/exonuclease/phosphatase family protein [Spirochaetes bacterium]|nr:endonuclease/exonuclease/phosphatase family protein [Spirochaetota bacterium]MBN2772116.1 endonuclease/exonuclease/phosphatase family protein [Spirochaetota bacterium]
MKQKKVATIILFTLPLFIFILFAAIKLSTYQPKDIEPAPINNRNHAPLLPDNSRIKILSWNLQYMAGKKYLFFYDEWDGSGPDKRPSPEEIQKTFKRVVQIINDEDPDILLLQEIDVDSKKTDYDDQLAILLSMISPEYKSYSSCWYWRASFVPHPKIMGKVGLKLAVISKYKIISSERHQLPVMPGNFIIRNLNFKRAVLKTEIGLKSGQTLTVMSTHLDAFAQGSDTMQKQVQAVSDLLNNLNNNSKNWLIAGDFNLIPPGQSYSLLPEDEKQYFQKETEMELLYNQFHVYPSLNDIQGENIYNWFTHFPNRQKAPDRIIDYIITSENIIPEDYFVRSNDTLDISDHLPLVMEFTIKSR